MKKKNRKAKFKKGRKFFKKSSNVSTIVSLNSKFSYGLHFQRLIQTQRTKRKRVLLSEKSRIECKPQREGNFKSRAASSQTQVTIIKV